MEEISVFSLLAEIEKLSVANDKKVGAIAVKNGELIAVGWNYCPDKRDPVTETEGTTKEETLHAEELMVINSARMGVSLLDSTVYISYSPCKHCAAVLLASGIGSVFYLSEFTKSNGIDLLIGNGVSCEKLEVETK